jgi:hypothetical protein
MQKMKGLLVMKAVRLAAVLETRVQLKIDMPWDLSDCY